MKLGKKNTETVVVPQRDPNQDRTVHQVAVWPGPADEEGNRPVEVPQDHDEVPDAVATELGLKPGQEIRVSFQKTTAAEDAKLAAKAAKNSDEYVDPFVLLQLFVDHAVTDSNIGIHRSKDLRVRQVRIDQIEADEFVWWLYVWLGLSAKMEIMKRASGVHEAKKKRR